MPTVHPFAKGAQLRVPPISRDKVTYNGMVMFAWDNHGRTVRQAEAKFDSLKFIFSLRMAYVVKYVSSAKTR